MRGLGYFSMTSLIFSDKHRVGQWVADQVEQSASWGREVLIATLGCSVLAWLKIFGAL